MCSSVVRSLDCRLQVVFLIRLKCGIILLDAPVTLIICIIFDENSSITCCNVPDLNQYVKSCGILISNLARPRQRAAKVVLNSEQYLSQVPNTVLAFNDM